MLKKIKKVKKNKKGISWQFYHDYDDIINFFIKFGADTLGGPILTNFIELMEAVLADKKDAEKKQQRQQNTQKIDHFIHLIDDLQPLLCYLVKIIEALPEYHKGMTDTEIKQLLNRHHKIEEVEKLIPALEKNISQSRIIQQNNAFFNQHRLTNNTWALRPLCTNLPVIFIKVGETQIIGRLQGDIQLYPPQISSKHLKITAINHNGAILTCQDLDSTNGIWINGKRTSQTAQLTPGDILAIGAIENEYYFDDGSGISRPSSIATPVTKHYFYYTINNQQRCYQIKENRQMVFGRGDACSLTIPYQAVSEQHLAIKLKNHQVYIKDLHSSNGTCLNGKTLDNAFYLLKDKDQITLAHIFKIRYKKQA